MKAGVLICIGSGRGLIPDGTGPVRTLKSADSSPDRYRSPSVQYYASKTYLAVAVDVDYFV